MPAPTTSALSPARTGLHSRHQSLEIKIDVPPSPSAHSPASPELSSNAHSHSHAHAHAHLRGGGDAIAGLPGAFGLEGIERFAAAYPAWPGTFGELLPLSLRGLRVFIVKAGTGGAMFRSLHSEFLNDMAVLLDDADLRALAAVCRQLPPLLGRAPAPAAAPATAR